MVQEQYGNMFEFFRFSSGYFVVVLLAFVLGFVSPIPCQEIGYEERLQNHLFCVELNVKESVSG